MRTELENLQQQVNTLEENADLITQDIVRIMPTIVSLLSENEKNMKEFHDTRAKDQEVLRQIQTFIRQEHEILSKIIKDYGSLQHVANTISETANQQFSAFAEKEKEIVTKLSQIPDSVNIRYIYGIDLKSTPVIIIMILFSVVISLGLGVLLEKDRQISDKKSYETRYRMVGLELPEVTSSIDSSYSVDPNKFHNLVIKREEEQKLKFNIKRKQKEIEDLKNTTTPKIKRKY
ncbi:hypothetical protein [Sphingobacterium corticibacterium]|uniref:Uncharacterized protein n=1 Tax=Sphingobacterium corticibacterium TaxID=2484746 RepID=A0A4Q6XIJ5_9SPHI|nr:hypothetical protein [Sphingobacterium corticibacterium]RZF59513.1 hypothetical protein EWE74_10120 [Sphingobacterium corticibacterium]